MIQLILFCEGPADAHTAMDLLDRVLQEHVPPSIAEMFRKNPEAFRVYAQDGRTEPLFHTDHAKSSSAGEYRPFFYLSRLNDYVHRYGVRVPRGHFGGRPGSADARMARAAFYIARKAAQRHKIDAAVLVRDMDDQPKERDIGLDQARREAAAWECFQIIIGQAHPMREAWVLAGFVPANDDEADRLKRLRKELGFCPCEQSHELKAKDEQAKKNPKRVLDELMEGDREREARCWNHTPLAILYERGQKNGLAPFLDEVRVSLPPRLNTPT